MSRDLDDLVTATEHAQPVHPVRELFRRRFFLGKFVKTEGGLWLAMLNALLAVPLMMAAFFYPVAVLTITGVLLVLAFVGWEGYVLWRRRRLRN